MKTARHPYVAVRCPHTNKTLLIKEGKDKSTGEWGWLYRNSIYQNIDDILDQRKDKK